MTTLECMYMQMWNDLFLHGKVALKGALWEISILEIATFETHFV